MTTALKIVWTIAGLAVTAFFGVGAWIEWNSLSIPLHVNGVLTRLEGVESKANSTLVNLDNGTKVWAASASDQAKAITGLVDDSHLTLSQINTVALTLNQQATALGPLIESTKETTDAATGALKSLTADEDALKPQIESVGPLIENANGTVTDLRSFLKTDAVTKTADGLAQTSQNFAGITGDFRTRFHDVLYPPPCKTFGCRFDRQFLPFLKEAPSMGEATYWTLQLFRGVKP